MFPLARQVQLATDHAKGATARLAGREIPSYEDTESTFDELKARIAKTLAYVNSVPAADIDGSEERDVTLKIGGASDDLPRAALSPLLRAAELLLPRDHRL